MKNFTLFVFSFLILATLSVLNGQVVEMEKSMSQGTMPGLEVELKGKEKSAEKIWKNYVKKLGKVDWDRKAKEHLLFNVMIDDIDNQTPITVFTKFDRNGDMSKGSFWFKRGDDFLNSNDHADELKAAGMWIQEYAYEVEKDYVMDVINDEEKNLGGLEKDLNKLQRQNENLHKDIEKAKEEIEKKTREIEENLKDQEKKAIEIENQKEKVQSVKKELSNIGKN